MKENAGKLSEADKKRYEAQIQIISKIMVIYEDPGYKDDDQEKGAEVVALMSEVSCLSIFRLCLLSCKDANVWIAA
jgi:peroxin-19